MSKLYDPYFGSNIASMWETDKTGPLVIDTNASFTARDGRVHTNACGWKAVHTGLRFLHYVGGLSQHLKSRFIAGEFEVEQLKIMCGPKGLDDFIDEKKDFQKIANTLGMCITVHDGLISENYGRGIALEIWHAKAHFVCALHPSFEALALQFAATYSGYTAFRWHPLQEYATAHNKPLKYYVDLISPIPYLATQCPGQFTPQPLLEIPEEVASQCTTTTWEVPWKTSEGSSETSSKTKKAATRDERHAEHNKKRRATCEKNRSSHCPDTRNDEAIARALQNESAPWITSEEQQQQIAQDEALARQLNDDEALAREFDAIALRDTPIRVAPSTRTDAPYAAPTPRVFTDTHTPEFVRLNAAFINTWL